MTTKRSRKTKCALKRRLHGVVSHLIADVPTNWLDPLLTGPKAVIGKGPLYNGQDIERLLNALKERLRKTANAPDQRADPKQPNL